MSHCSEVTDRLSGKIVGIEDNTEEHDNMLEEIYATVYVKMINGKTISIRHHRNMTAAVISDEVERRSLIPRDMIRLVHKGKMISEKKTMKENNIEAKATIEMSLRLLGGMEVNEQMDTHETEEDREKKRKLDEEKEGKTTKPYDDMVYLKRDIMEAVFRDPHEMSSVRGAASEFALRRRVFAGRALVCPPRAKVCSDTLQQRGFLITSICLRRLVPAPMRETTQLVENQVAAAHARCIAYDGQVVPRGSV